MKYIFYDELLIMYYLVFFLIHIYLFFSLDGMQTKYLAPKQKAIGPLLGKKKFHKVPTITSEEVFAFVVPTICISASGHLFDITAEKINQVCTEFSFEKLINQRSKMYHLTKTLLLSSLACIIGQKHLIPAICSTEFFLYREQWAENLLLNQERVRAEVQLQDLNNSFVHKKSFLDLTKNLFSLKGLKLLVKPALSIFPYSIQVINFPLEKLGVFKNEHFLHEPFSLRLIQLFAWYYDHSIEFVFYNLYLERENDQLSLKKLMTFLTLYSVVSFCKYFIYKKFLFKNIDIYEGFSTKEWFLIEGISKCVAPLLFCASRDFFDESLIIKNLFARFLFNLAIIFGTKWYFLYFQQQSKIKFFQQMGKNFNQCNDFINNLYTNIDK